MRSFFDMEIWKGVIRYNAPKWFIVSIQYVKSYLFVRIFDCFNRIKSRHLICKIAMPLCLYSTAPKTS